jgi:1,4-dihydroxy-2-naphthoate octaprenyltransferase
MNYDRLTLENAINLAAPHTWVASILPVLLGAALCLAISGIFHPLLFTLMLVASVLLQSSVNTLNDYHDFIKGTDRVENSDDPSDAVLVYNNLNPSHARILGFGFMAAAAALGIYPVICGGIITLAIGFIGCLIIVLYSAGKHSLSSLPVGEAVSGIIMGGLITCGFFSAVAPDVTVALLLKVFLLSVPMIIGIALIMMTNNICDIERDGETSRTTLPVILGRPRAILAYRIIATVWILAIVILISVFFTWGIIAGMFVLMGSIPVIKKLLTAPLIPERRGPCMGVIVKSNYCFGAAYLAGIASYIIIKQL